MAREYSTVNVERNGKLRCLMLGFNHRDDAVGVTSHHPRGVVNVGVSADELECCVGSGREAVD